jgi:hypothetical protein
MAKTIDDLRIWKHSHGTHQTVPRLDGRREKLVEECTLTLYRDTARRQGERFRNEMRRGDFFYLCHGNDVQLFGRITTQLRKPRSRWVERKYKVIRFRLAKSSCFSGDRKAWAPSGDTTCWQVPSRDLKDFERNILKPFFALSLRNLVKMPRVTSKPGAVQPLIEEEKEDPPWRRTPQRYDALQKPAHVVRMHTESSRLYDPDKLATRRSAHEKCLQRFARLFPQRRTYSSDYDLLVVKKPKVLLVEVKTIRNDAKEQLRLALGQVLYYENLSVRIHYPKFKVSRLVVTDAKAPDYLVQFLEKYRIGLAWQPVREKAGVSPLGKRILEAFGVRFR